jgi:MinD-like ATPase involved in chromosome partitioning or flagellar assembly
MGRTTICLCSAKGGTGKTALAASLAVLLADMGKRVLLLDADAATNGLTLLMLKALRSATEGEAHAGLFDWSTPEPLQIKEGLLFVPAFGRMQLTLPGPPPLDQMLRERVPLLRESGEHEAEVIIIDAEAGLESSTQAAIALADRAVIVTEFDPMSATGVERLRSGFASAWPTDGTYILVNKILPELARIESDYFVAWRHLPPIPFDFAVMRAYTRGEVPFDTENPSPFARALVRVASSLLPELSRALDDWLQHKVVALKRPLEEQLGGLVLQISRLEDELLRLKVDSELASTSDEPHPLLVPLPLLLRHIASYMAEGPLWWLLLATAGACMMVGGIALAAAKPGSSAGGALILMGLIIILGWVIGSCVAAWQLYRQRRARGMESERRRFVERRARAAMEQRNIEQTLERLLQEKGQIESLLATEPAAFLERATDNRRGPPP